MDASSPGCVTAGHGSWLAHAGGICWRALDGRGDLMKTIPWHWLGSHRLCPLHAAPIFSLWLSPSLTVVCHHKGSLQLHPQHAEHLPYLFPLVVLGFPPPAYLTLNAHSMSQALDRSSGPASTSAPSPHDIKLTGWREKQVRTLHATKIG